MLLKIGELSESKKGKPGRVAEKPSEYAVDKYILTDIERDYVDKLLGILRGMNQQAKLAVQINIDALSRHKKEKVEIEEAHLRQLAEGAKPPLTPTLYHSGYKSP